MSYAPASGALPQAIRTSSQGLQQGLIDMPTFDGTIQAYYAAPEQAQGCPLILVVQEIFGIHEHIQDICRRFAHEGYWAVAVQLYQRQGNANDYTDIPSLIEHIVSKVPDIQVMSDLDAAVFWATQQGADPERVGITGFCWGGRITWLYAAHNPACKAGVAWYGRLSRGHGPEHTRNPLDVANALYAPVLGLYGGRDAGIPVQDCEAMQVRLAQGSGASQDSRIIVYPDADHAFFADYRASYNEKDAHDAWVNTLAWFQRYMG